MSKRGTKERLLEAAIILFGEKGYDAASLRDICGRAEANVGAVNYHFKDKQGLYRAVLEHLTAECKGFHHQVEASLPEDKLHSLIRASLTDVFNDRGNLQEKLIFKEISDPSEDLLELIREPLRTVFARFVAVVEELAPRPLEIDEVQLIVLSIFGQIDYYRMFYKFVPELLGEEKAEALTLDVLTGHVLRFSLAAIRSY